MADIITRRKFVVWLSAASAGLVAACGAPSAQQSSPPQSSAPAAPPKSESVPAPQTAPAARDGGALSAWDQLVADARQEGKVVVQNPAGSGYRLALDEFTKAYPGIEVEQQSFPDAATYIPKIKGERAAGVYSIDVIASTVTPLLQILKPEGIIDPIRPLFIHPEVVDDKAWFGGFESRWADLTKSHVFRHQITVSRPVYINSKLVADGEIRSIDDLLDPKWKGKIVTSDLTQGYIYTPSTVIRDQRGEDFLRKLFVEQEPMMIRDRRQAVETLVRGAAPVGFGLHPIIMGDFVKEGLAGDVKNPDVAGGTYSGGEILGLYKNAPHPKAAQLFINWMLMKDGQIAWSIANRYNSARTDIPLVDPENAPSGTLTDPTQEEWMERTSETQEFLRSLTTT